MGFMGKDELENFFKNLRYGDIVTIVQDLSKGDMVDNMISTSTMEFGPRTRNYIRESLMRKIIIDVSRRTYW